MVAVAPSSAAADAAAKASAAPPPASRAPVSASRPGSSASSMVLSPGTAPPSAATPSTPARSASRSRAADTACSSPRSLPARRSSVPYSGPDAPPTVLISVRPISTSTAPGVSGGSCSTALRAATKPRRMFVPWSASPMGESSSVSRADSRFQAAGGQLQPAAQEGGVDRCLGVGVCVHRGRAVLSPVVRDTCRSAAGAVGAGGEGVSSPSAGPGSRPGRPTAAAVPRRPGRSSPRRPPCPARSRSCRPGCGPPGPAARRAPAAPRR